MDFDLNYKLSGLNSAVTEQELVLKQLLFREGISFTFQQKFNLSNQWYVVDFLIANSLLLECSATNMFKHDVALKQKALQLETKCSHLKTCTSYPFWVLFESQRPIGTHLLTTLYRLMPSIDRLLTSSAMVLENLLGFISENEIFHKSKTEDSSFYSSSSSLGPSSRTYTSNSLQNPLLGEKISFLTSDSVSSSQLRRFPDKFPLSSSSCLLNIYSQVLKKNFKDRNEGII